jgi:hypothetical protein
MIMDPPSPAPPKSKPIHPKSFIPFALSPGTIPGCVRSLISARALSSKMLASHPSQPTHKPAIKLLHVLYQLRGEGKGEKRDKREAGRGGNFIHPRKVVQSNMMSMISGIHTRRKLSRRPFSSRFPFPETFQPQPRPQSNLGTYGPETKHSFIPIKHASCCLTFVRIADLFVLPLYLVRIVTDVRSN